MVFTVSCIFSAIASSIGILLCVSLDLFLAAKGLKHISDVKSECLPVILLLGKTFG